MRPRTAFVTDGDQRPALALTRSLGRRGICVLVGAEQSDRLLTFRTAKLTVAAAQQIPLSIDGDPADCQSLECHVLRHALRIIAGNNDPAEGSGVAASEK